MRMVADGGGQFGACAKLSHEPRLADRRRMTWPSRRNRSEVSSSATMKIASAAPFFGFVSG